jgi:hypothetical protein
MQFSITAKKQKPTHLFTIETAGELLKGGVDVGKLCELSFVSCKVVGTDLELTAHEATEGVSYNLLDPAGNVLGFYVLNTKLSRITVDHCLDNVDSEFEFIFDLKEKEAASE